MLTIKSLLMLSGLMLLMFCIGMMSAEPYAMPTVKLNNEPITCYVEMQHMSAPVKTTHSFTGKIKKAKDVQ